VIDDPSALNAASCVNRDVTLEGDIAEAEASAAAGAKFPPKYGAVRSRDCELMMRECNCTDDCTSSDNLYATSRLKAHWQRNRVAPCIESHQAANLPIFDAYCSLQLFSVVSFQKQTCSGLSRRAIGSQCTRFGITQALEVAISLRSVECKDEVTTRARKHLLKLPDGFFHLTF
jgi:hypothetical protein